MGGSEIWFTLYAQYVGRFERYSSGSGGDVLGGTFGTFGLIIAFVFWVYYSGIVLCLGGLMALLHEKRHRSSRQAASTEAEEPADVPSSPTTREASDTPGHPIRTGTAEDQPPLQTTPSSKASEDLSVK